MLHGEIGDSLDVDLILVETESDRPLSLRVFIILDDWFHVGL